MKSRSLIIVSSIDLMIVFALSGCGSTSKNVQTDTTTISQEKVEMDESFDPFSLGDYRLDVEPQANESSEELDYTFLVTPNEDSTIGATEVAGYRVQIFASNDQDEANAVRRDAILRFDEDVYIVFDNPFYKVRVGDCLSRYEADALQADAEKQGFLDAWVVRTKIFVKKSAKGKQ